MDVSEKAKMNKLTEKDEPNKMGAMKQEGSMKQKIFKHQRKHSIEVDTTEESLANDNQAKQQKLTV